MAKLTRKSLIQVKAETTYGTDPSPIGSDALLVRSLEITPIEADTVSRELIRPYLGNSPQLLSATRVAITFQVELAGSGTAGTAPRYGSLLEACGMNATEVASTSVTYAPVSSAFESCTIYYNGDGIRHKLTGCRGTFSLSCEVGAIPYIEFQMTGIYNAPTDTASPSVTYSNQASPLVFRDGNTSAFQFFSYAGCLQSFSFEMGNEIIYRELVGCTKEVMIANRAASGTVMLEAVALSSFNPFSIAQTETTGNLTFQHGTTAGNIVTVTCAQTDITQPSYGDSDGIIMLEVPYVALPSGSGNDEISIAFT